MIRRELGVFLAVGVTTVLLDFTAYRALVWSGVAVDIAKAAGFLTGTLFAYLANRFWTFGHSSHVAGTVWRFGLLYVLTLGANVVMNAAALRSLHGASFAVQAAFLLATGISATLNFLGMKFFVFRTAEPRP